MNEFGGTPEAPEIRIGHKVICIDADFSNASSMIRLLFEFPKSGRIYTVREILASSLLMKEIVNPVVTWRSCGGIRVELSFDIPRFRIASDFEIEGAKQDLLALKGSSIFRGSLN